MSLFFVAYFHLLDQPTGTPTVVPASVIDHLVGFQPQFFYLYASLWLYVSLVPAIMPDRRSLIRYGVVIGMVCLVGLAVFYLYPTRIERDPSLWINQPEFAWLSAVDSSGNAFPSLHVATALFSAYWLDRTIRALRMPASIRWLSALWALGIVYSTLAIAQHVMWDVVGGVVLAMVGVMLSAPWVFVGSNAPEANAAPISVARFRTGRK
ncbi:phosphatase PAP2 family protein [Guyparkeria hydrothermalis]|uniref:phosphatase PAP2 family protein n=1 Tax=Guyparkeria hydrothermalis TaxID=923 RepID=UPI002020BE39|nr:phosphatase PAP2 family protein [Guyparkeria hydrothermalis]MCL7743805.1 phosphatase PAP2 family protein [Guyparkeria hydrothermalis]